MYNREKVWAVVVTYNRLQLLQECIDSIRIQSRRPDEILVVNNGSIDGTKEWLESQDVLKVIHQENLGGAGGFHNGMKYAIQSGADFVWIMDDDVIVKPDALHKLINAAHRLGDFGFLASTVYGVDGNLLNVPSVDMRATQNGYPKWHRFLSRGIVQIREATFVSLLFPRKTIKKFGLPIREFFMWGDDTEYTYRVTKHVPAYLVGRSVVIHKRSIQTAPSIFTEVDRERIKKYFFMYRNMIYRKRIRSGGYCYRFVTKSIIRDIARCPFSPPHRLLKSRIILSGYLCGLYFKPHQDYID